MAVGTLPEVSRKSPAYTVTYDWTDHVMNVGYIKFYGACSTVTGGTHKEYFLTTDSSISSTTGDAGGDTGIYTETTALDLDLDISINVPLTVAAGIAYVEIPFHLAGNDPLSCTVTIYHVRGVTETSLGTKQMHAVSADACYLRELLKVTLAQQVFAIGDILRLNVVAACADDFKTYHDPASGLTITDREGRVCGTDLTFTCPFKIDL